LNFGKGVLQHGESVNITGLVVARPASALALCCILAENDLESRAKRNFLKDFSVAPAGDSGNSVDITGQPARAI
jgi:hypothetical protein